jgi:hypothetical protein
MRRRRVGVVMRGDETETHVGSQGADTPRRGHRARDGLSDHDRLELRFAGEPAELGHDGHGFAGEVVGEGDVHHPSRVAARDLLGGTIVLAALRFRSRHDADPGRLQLCWGRGVRAGFLSAGARGHGDQRCGRHRDERAREDGIHSLARCGWGRRCIGQLGARGGLGRQHSSGRSLAHDRGIGLRRGEPVPPPSPQAGGGRVAV